MYHKLYYKERGIYMRQWSIPTVRKMGLEKTQGFPGNAGRDSWMSEEEEKEFESKCGATGSGECECQ